MGIFDFFKRKDEEKVGSEQRRAAQNPINSGQDAEQPESDEVTPPGANKGFSPKDRTPAPSQRFYEVQEGDSLSGIAKKRYGDASKWEVIYEANRKEIKDPDKIEAGQVLKMPDINKEEK